MHSPHKESLRWTIEEEQSFGVVVGGGAWLAIMLAAAGNRRKTHMDQQRHTRSLARAPGESKDVVAPVF